MATVYLLTHTDGVRAQLAWHAPTEQQATEGWQQHSVVRANATSTAMRVMLAWLRDNASSALLAALPEHTRAMMDSNGGLMAVAS